MQHVGRTFEHERLDVRQPPEQQCLALLPHGRDVLAEAADHGERRLRDALGVLLAELPLLDGGQLLLEERRCVGDHLVERGRGDARRGSRRRRRRASTRRPPRPDRPRGSARPRAWPSRGPTRRGSARRISAGSSSVSEATSVRSVERELQRHQRARRVAARCARSIPSCSHQPVAVARVVGDLQRPPGMAAARVARAVVGDRGGSRRAPARRRTARSSRRTGRRG